MNETLSRPKLLEFVVAVTVASLCGAPAGAARLPTASEAPCHGPAPDNRSAHGFLTLVTPTLPP